MQEHELSHICHRCVPDTHLANEVFNTGQLRTCSYCYENRNAVTLDALADRILDVISRYFVLTPDYPADPDDLITLALGFDWERRGCTPQEVVTKVSGLNEEVAEEIVGLLRGFHAYQIAKYGGEDPYGDEAPYEEIGPNAGPFWGIWNTVPDGIRHQARFFNEEAENALDRLFEDLFDLTTSKGEPVVQTIDPEYCDTFIWRARKASTISQVETILGNPAVELAPPPPDHATPGRMNASGIPVFYGAFEQDTCIAEVRPPVGSYVVMGKFKLLRAIRLLDLNLLRHVFIETTYFDPLYPDRSNRVAFLQRLSEELTKPVMPEDEEGVPCHASNSRISGPKAYPED